MEWPFNCESRNEGCRLFVRAGGPLIRAKKFVQLPAGAPKKRGLNASRLTPGFTSIVASHGFRRDESACYPSIRTPSISKKIFIGHVLTHMQTLSNYRHEWFSNIRGDILSGIVVAPP
jgi:hypothetical protein